MEFKGLSEREVSERLRKHGPNELEKKSRVTVLELFVAQFGSFIILLLLAAAVISFMVSESLLDSAAILVAALLSVALSTIQEYRGEQAMQALIKMTALRARAIRNGREKVVDTKELVPGDIVIVEEGDKVPADLELLKSSSVLADESMLTGESTPVEKDIGLPNEGKTLYMGTVVARGRAVCAVKATGMGTEMGRIVKTIRVREEKTPLQKKLDWLASRIGLAGIGACILIFFIGRIVYPDLSWDQMLLIAVTLAVASVPEGLATTVTITLAIGMKKMAAHSAIVRKLLAVESLGSVTVICSDKTGTITKNMMTVREVFAGGRRIDVTGDGYDGPGRLMLGGKTLGRHGKAIEMLLKTSVLCNTSEISRHYGRAEVVGDPTEVALLVLAEKAGFDHKGFRRKNPFEGDPLFDSKHKLMVSVNKVGRKRVAFVKGAFESVMERAGSMMTDRGAVKLGGAIKRKLSKENDAMASRGMRVLAFAYRELPKTERRGEADRGLVFIGLVGMVDPPREEVSNAVKTCKDAGIRVVMITGDNPVTAKAIATQVGIFKPGDRIITGEELGRMSERELRTASDSVSIYARVLPEHKLRIVNALKGRGGVVAMTGDGVNDVPGIKRADVGVAMGSGTDVAKESSEVVLADDNFATIVRAVKYGRNIYDNIRNFVRFQFSTNVAAVATMFIVPFTRLPLPFTPLDLLWINIIMDGPPALALGMEPPRDVMKRKPRNPKEHIVSGLMHGVLITGAVMCVGTILLLVLAQAKDPGDASTIAFTGFVVFQLFNALNCRSGKDSLLLNFWRNRYLLLALVGCALLQVMIVYLEPLQRVFKTTALESNDWVLILLVASSVIVVEEVRKFFVRRNGDENA